MSLGNGDINLMASALLAKELTNPNGTNSAHYTMKEDQKKAYSWEIKPILKQTNLRYQNRQNFSF